MGRIRTIKPEFFTSLTIADLPLTARLTFVGLWTHVDDDGRCIDEPRLIRAAVWPLDDRTAGDVEEDLRALHDASLIERYEHAGRRFLAVTNWREHQRIDKPKASKLPAPKEADPLATTTPDPASTCGNADFGDTSTTDPGPVHDTSTTDPGRVPVGKEGKGREQGKEHTSPPDAADPQLALVETSTSRQAARPRASPRLPPKQAEAMFEEFYDAYPRHEGKQAARKAWDKAIGRASPEAILTGARRLAGDPNLPEKRWIPHPQTWLNRDGWDDDPLPARDETKGRPRVAAGNEDHWASGGTFGMPP